LLSKQQHVAERASARFMKRVAEAGDAPVDILRSVLTSFIPTDDESREAMLMFVALHTASLIDTTLARPEAQQVPRALQKLVAKQLRRAQLPKGSDPEMEAAVLVAMVPSLAQAVLDGMYTADAAIAIIDYALGRILG
jgi:hypothetical protein